MTNTTRPQTNPSLPNFDLAAWTVEQTERNAALGVMTRCPVCNAGVGKWCVGLKGGTTHDERKPKATHTYLPEYTAHGCCDLPREAHTVEVVRIDGKLRKVAI